MVTQQFTNWLANHSFKNLANTSASPNSSTAGTALFATTYSYKSPTAKWIDVGFGNSVERNTDYNLADANSAHEYLICISQSAVAKQNGEIYSAEAVFKNEGNSPINVKEIGMFIGSVSSATNAYTDCLMVGRDLLSDTVQIQPGDSYKFTYQVSLNAQSVIEEG